MPLTLYQEGEKPDSERMSKDVNLQSHLHGVWYANRKAQTQHLHIALANMTKNVVNTQLLLDWPSGKNRSLGNRKAG